MASDTKRLFVRSNELYERALKTIPLASQTFSKSAMNFPRGASPLFLEKGKGAYVWDYDGNKYIDYVSGLMPVILGYCDPDVDNAIRNQLDNGIVFSLPSDLEVKLSEKLTELIPCAEMVRFGKNGSDVTSAAIRLARAYTGRDRVAVCGYHGWHDWYIGTTVRNLGVPRSVQDLSSKFTFNDIDSLEILLKDDSTNFAAVIMEPTGVCEPEDNFLENVRKLCDQYGVVLVFDEIVTGFRIDMGGAQRKYGVTPDLSTFGKSMANGMPISAIVGKREIMKLMDDIFFSGTFGGETLSLAAALATITKLENINAPEIFEQMGSNIHNAVQSIITDFRLDDVVSVTGVDWWPRIAVGAHGSTSQIEVNTLLRQELIEHGIFMGGGFNLSIAHNDDNIISETLIGIHQALERFSTYLKTDNPMFNLRGELIKPVFKVR
jgi:glutamate-1-semialdehyde 2,1-aminomutase